MGLVTIAINESSQHCQLVITTSTNTLHAMYMPLFGKHESLESSIQESWNQAGF